jgi:hypothetical protein
MKTVFILSAARTPIGKYGGSRRDFTAPDLRVIAARAGLERAGIAAEEIDVVIFGHARQGQQRPEPGASDRGAVWGPPSRSGLYGNMACASGFQAIVLGYQEIVLGNAEAVLVGGIESMSCVRALPGRSCAMGGHGLGIKSSWMACTATASFAPMARLVMGETAEVLAEQYRITREESVIPDEFPAVTVPNPVEDWRQLREGIRRGFGGADNGHVASRDEAAQGAPRLGYTLRLGGLGMALEIESLVLDQPRAPDGF